MGKKLTIEYVDNYFDEYGWVLLEPYTNNNKYKMECLCPNGHLNYTDFNSFSQKIINQRNLCNSCSGFVVKYTYDDVKSYIESFGYKLLSTEYIDQHQKLNIICPENHLCSSTFNNFKNNNSRCMKCVKKELGLKYKHDFTYIKECIEKFEYKLLSDEYTNNKQKLDVECPNEHIIEIRFDAFKNGSRCKICHLNKLNEQKLNNDSLEINKKLRVSKEKKWIIKHMKDDPNYELFLLNPSGYVIDHIIPVKAFQEYVSNNKNNNIDLIKLKLIINSKKNLQLLTFEENSVKSDIYDINILNKYISENYT